MLADVLNAQAAFAYAAAIRAQPSGYISGDGYDALCCSVMRPAADPC